MKVITFRVSDREASELKARAGKDVSAFIRAQLFDRPDPAEVLELVLDRVAALIPESASDTTDSGRDPVALETLLLLRGLAEPATLRSVRGSLTRHGITPLSLDERS